MISLSSLSASSSIPSLSVLAAASNRSSIGQSCISSVLVVTVPIGSRHDSLAEAPWESSSGGGGGGADLDGVVLIVWIIAFSCLNTSLANEQMIADGLLARNKQTAAATVDRIRPLSHGVQWTRPSLCLQSLQLLFIRCSFVL